MQAHVANDRRGPQLASPRGPTPTSRGDPIRQQSRTGRELPKATLDKAMQARNLCLDLPRPYQKGFASGLPVGYDSRVVVTNRWADSHGIPGG
jgi:hypothetical protein